jgi:hypoxanthine phosphoribosyltransferase
MQMPRREMIRWKEVDKLIDHLLTQFDHDFEGMVMITRGGIVPGGMLAEAMDITHVLTAAVDFPTEIEFESDRPASLMVWPKFMQFPKDDLLEGRRMLVVDDVWGSGRTITSVKNRVSAAGGLPYTCVLHFNPYRSLFGKARPDYYAATTDAFIVYPWEIGRDPDRALLTDF